MGRGSRRLAHHGWRRFATTTALLACAGATLAACGDDTGGQTGTAGTSAQTKTDEPARIAFFDYAVGNTYTKAVQDGIRAAADKAGASVEVFDAQAKADRQFAAMQDALASGDFDAILVIPINAVGLTPLFKQAQEAGIPVGTVSYAAGEDLTTLDPQAEGVQVAVLDTAADRGTWMGEMTVDACDGIDPCKVAYMPGTPGTPVEETFQKFFEEAIAAAPNIDVVSTQPGELQAGPASKVIQNVLQRTPDLNVVTAAGDQMAHGAQIGLEKAGKKVGSGDGEVRLIGIGASELGIESIASGDWFGTVLSLPYDEGKLAAESIIDVAGGKSGPIGVSAARESGIDPKVTSDNVDKVTAQWAG